MSNYIEPSVAKALADTNKLVQKNIKMLNKHTDKRDDQNESDISDTQNALIESDEARIEEMSETENALCELSEEVDERLSDIENALCELTEE